MSASLIDYLKTWPLYCLPQHALTAIVYKITRAESPALKNFLVKQFIRLFKVDMKEATRESHIDYVSFNDFFTRQLKEEARNTHLDVNVILSPVDGAVSQIANIENGQLIQAKNKSYSLSSLLANDAEMISFFQNGSFSTLYLSPRDYHRIHMPCYGQLVKTIYVPGDLFAVNTASVRTINNLFARNERFISLFKTEFGNMALIMVGAIFVGSMETVWQGEITPAKQRTITKKSFSDQEVKLDQGEEMGRFNMGSTVILLFEQECIDWNSTLNAGHAIQMGQEIARLRSIT